MGDPQIKVSYNTGLYIHKKLHNKKTRFSGMSLQVHSFIIYDLIELYNVKTLCDYGCGKAKMWLKKGLYDLYNLNKGDVKLYDPCVKEFNTYPTGKYDMTICIDVMEHIPEDSVDEVLKNIFDMTNKIVYFSISYRKASKVFDLNGNSINVHLTVKPPEWWREKIEKYRGDIIVEGV